MNARPVNTGVVAYDDFCARSVRHDFASCEHVDVVISIVGIDGHIVANDESCLFVDLHKRHFFEFHFFSNRYIRTLEQEVSEIRNDVIVYFSQSDSHGGQIREKKLLAVGFWLLAFGYWLLAFLVFCNVEGVVLDFVVFVIFEDDHIF